jgi:hypothetical protein
MDPGWKALRPRMRFIKFETLKTEMLKFKNQGRRSATVPTNDLAGTETGDRKPETGDLFFTAKTPKAQK